MTGKLLAGVAGIGLVLACGVANAADIPPLGAEAGMEPDGRKVSVIAETAIIGVLNIGLSGAVLGVAGAGVDVKFSSGLGVSLATQFIAVPAGPVYIGLADGRVYYETGKFEFGLHALISAALVPFSGTGYAFGTDAAYEGERVSVTSETLFSFNSGGFDGWQSTTEVTFDPHEKVEVLTTIFASGSTGLGTAVTLDSQATITVAPRFELVPSVTVGFNTMGTTDIGAGLEARFPLGAITPFVAVDWTNGVGTFLQVGADLEKQIGTGPFTLFGTAVFAPDLSGAGNHAILAGIGIRYETGEDPPDFFLDAFSGAL